MSRTEGTVSLPHNLAEDGRILIGSVDDRGYAPRMLMAQRERRLKPPICSRTGIIFQR